MSPAANDGAVSQITPSGGVVGDTRLAPRISIHVFCAISGPPPAVFTEATAVTSGMAARATRLPSYSVNQMAPSGPALIAYGFAADFGIGNSSIRPSTVILTSLFPRSSTNQSALSGPEMIPD